MPLASQKSKEKPLTARQIAANCEGLKVHFPYIKEREAKETCSKELDTPLSEGHKAVLDAAFSARSAESNAVMCYMALCIEIRRHQLAPKEVTVLLSAAGYNYSRISEVKRVAFVSDEIFQKFLSEGLGFRSALRLARGGERAANEHPADTTASTSEPADEEEGDGNPGEGVNDAPQPELDESPNALVSKLVSVLRLDKLDFVPDFLRRGFENKSFLKTFKQKGGVAHAVIGNYRVIVIPMQGLN
ncbi:hypothetical protein SAMN05444156_2446 [Verrucomicrobium sp. GAS474]|nr:hypothetical protein SAMN05444156_2446 [Verrucomicrobium sp. GAS474]